MSKTGTLKARVPGASAVDLLLDTDPGLGSPATIAGTEGDDEVFEFALTGLAADTDYYYGFDGSTVEGRFHTPDDDGAEYSFTVAAASCAGHSGGQFVNDDVSDAPTFDRIADRFVAGTIEGFIHLGDRHYRDITTNNVASFRSAYQDVMAAARQNGMHLGGWVAYQWSDHDYGSNDSDGTSASKPAAQSVYREHVPLPASGLPSGSDIYYSFVVGRVEFFVLDTRSNRSPKGNTDNSSKTMLGATQKAWLLAAMAASAAEVLVVLCESPWNSTNPISWGVYSTEQDELIAQWTSDGILDKILIVNGDYHFSALDDGSNAPGGVPVVACGPLDAGYSTSEGTYSGGIFKVSHQQYVTLEFDDQSTDIVVTATIWAVDGTDETDVGSMQLTYTP